MLLKIDFNENNVIYKSNRRIVLKVNYYAEFANAAHVCTVKGNTIEDFYENPSLSSKSISIGQKGGITVE